MSGEPTLTEPPVPLALARLQGRPSRATPRGLGLHRPSLPLASLQESVDETPRRFSDEPYSPDTDDDESFPEEVVSVSQSPTLSISNGRRASAAPFSERYRQLSECDEPIPEMPRRASVAVPMADGLVAHDKGRRRSWAARLQLERKKRRKSGGNDTDEENEPVGYVRQKRPSWWNVFVPDNMLKNRSRRASQQLSRSEESIGQSFKRSKSRSVDHGFAAPFDLESLRSKVEGRFDAINRDEDEQAKRLPPPPPIKTMTYTVRDRDTLTSLAARFDTTPSELTKLNRLATQFIFPGQALQVPDKRKDGDKESDGRSESGDNTSESTQGNSEPSQEKEILDSLRPGSPETQTSSSNPQRFLKINVRHITDGQGVVSGVLLVTPNAVMFDPNVSDTLVMEHGPESYGVIAPMEYVVNAAIFYDIAHMRTHGPDHNTHKAEQAEIYYLNKSELSPGKDSLLVKDETFPELQAAGEGAEEGGERGEEAGDAEDRPGAAFPKAFERDLVTPTNLQQPTTEERRASLLDHHWAIPSKDRNSIDQGSEGDDVFQASSLSSTKDESQDGTKDDSQYSKDESRDVVPEAEAERAPADRDAHHLVKLSYHDSGIDIRDPLLNVSNAAAQNKKVHHFIEHDYHYHEIEPIQESPEPDHWECDVFYEAKFLERFALDDIRRTSGDTHFNSSMSYDSQGHRRRSSDTHYKRRMSQERKSQDFYGQKRMSQDSGGLRRKSQDNYGPRRMSQDSCGQKRMSQDDCGQTRISQDSCGQKRMSQDDCGQRRMSQDSLGLRRMYQDSDGLSRMSIDSHGSSWSCDSHDKVYSDADIVLSADWVPPVCLARGEPPLSAPPLGESERARKPAAVSFSLDASQKEDNVKPDKKNKMLKRLSYPLSWVEGLTGEGQTSESLPTSAADTNNSTSVFSKVFNSSPMNLVEFGTGLFLSKTPSEEAPQDALASGRSSLGGFGRSHSKSTSSSGSQPPRLDYRSMVSVDDMPDLFASFDKLIPRPARAPDAPPLYLRLRMGRPAGRALPRATPLMSYGRKRMKPEYWFGVPRNRVDDLFKFLTHWVPDRYGPLGDVTAQGYELIDSDTEWDDDDAKPGNKGERVGSTGDVSDITRESWELLKAPYVKIYSIMKSQAEALGESLGEEPHPEVLSMSDELRRALYSSHASVDMEFCPPDLIGISEILTMEHREKLCSVLPARAQGYMWSLAFSTSQHGFSLASMYRKMQRVESPVLLLIQDTQNNVFGALTSTALHPSEHFYGTGESLLFSFQRVEDRSPADKPDDKPNDDAKDTPDSDEKDELSPAPFKTKFKYWGWTGDNMYFIRGSTDNISIGAGDGRFGLWLDGDLYLGRTQRCTTYGNEPLSTTEDFVVKIMECWTFI